MGLKGEVDIRLSERLKNYHIGVDDISLVHVNFSDRFTDAVEAKQIAEQEAKKAGFMVLKALKESEVKINLAKGEAAAHRILQDSLSPEVLQNKAISPPWPLCGRGARVLPLTNEYWRQWWP